MSRELSGWLEVTATLRTTEPMSVGGVSSQLETDLPLARNGRGEIYVPGTSLAGAMRSWMTESFAHEAAVDMLWGSPLDGGGASHILVSDAVINLQGLRDEIWDGVALDRDLGVASNRLKFDRAVVPAGALISLAFEVELPADSKMAAAFRNLVGYLLQALAREEIGLGAASTRGFGRCKTEGRPIISERSLTSKPALIAWLRSVAATTAGPATPKSGTDLRTEQLLRPLAVQAPAEAPIITLEIKWKPDGPVMVKAGYDGVAVDALPFLSSGEKTGTTLVLPGSSLKGAFRSQAERIIRTVRGDRPGVWGPEAPGPHQRQIDEPLVDVLFGSPRPAQQAPGSTRGQGALSVGTCVATSLGSSRDNWRRLQVAQDNSTTNQQLADMKASFDPANREKAYLQAASHVALDRWTGGGAEHLLFSGFEPFNVEWEPLVLRVDFRRLTSKPLRDAAVALLFLLVRDLGDGRLTIGYGANRGFGGVTVKKASFKVPAAQDTADYAWLNGSVLDATTLDRTRLTELQTAWTSWIDTAVAPPEVEAQ